MSIGSIAALLAAQSGGSEAPVNEAPHAEQVKTLQAFAARYQENWIPEVGDLVQSRKDGLIGRAGQPRIVVEVNRNAEPVFFTDVESSGAPYNGTRYNIRTATVSVEGSILLNWAEAINFEPYVGDEAEPAAEA